MPAKPDEPLRTPQVAKAPSASRAASSSVLRFAVISDTHDSLYCGLQQGRWLQPAVAWLNQQQPDFVVGLGDLVAGGGDCKSFPGRGADVSLAAQLDVLKRELLEPLEAPFVPITGNHDLFGGYSSDPDYPARTWQRFWSENSRELLPAVRQAQSKPFYRFKAAGRGFAVIGYFDTRGLSREELKWIRANVRKEDLVFRHVNPFGLTTHPRLVGSAIRDVEVQRVELLPKALRRKKVAALFSGHTHAFYDGRCDGLRFVNTGSLGARAMEMLRGWESSPHRFQQAFVWAEISAAGQLEVQFQVWDATCECFRTFDKSLFPAHIQAEWEDRGAWHEGVAASCKAER